MRTMLRMVVAVVAVALVVAGAHADEEKVPLDKLPKAVTDAVKKRFPKAEMVEAAKETVGDKTEYEVSIKDGGVKIDVMLTPDGKITVIEKVIAAKDLPKAVTDTLETKYPKATYTTIEEVIRVADGKEALDYYEVLLVTANKKTFEVEIAADGKVKLAEEKTEEKKEEEKDEKLPLDKVPTAIKDAVKFKYPKAEIVSAEKGDVDGTKVYEFKLKEGTKEWEVAFTPDAKFHSSEEPLAEAALPAKVKEAYTKKYGDAKFISAEMETTGEGDKAKVIYEIILQKGTDKLEAQFDPDGKFVAETKVKDKKGEKKDKQ